MEIASSTQKFTLMPSQPPSSISPQTKNLLISLGFTIAEVLISGVIGYYTCKWLLKDMRAGSNTQSRGVSLRLRRLQEKLNKRRKKGEAAMVLELNEHELQIAQEIVFPEEIGVGFDTIGGLEYEKRELRDLIIRPLKHATIFQNSSLAQPPKGILLHGPPGTGKTMLAKAIASETDVTFINIQQSTLLSKYFGESEHMVRATFTLARKLQPSIIFIDELDSFMSKRKGDDHHASASIKSEFLSLWDGMTSSDGIMVVGATNRPTHIDAAFLRRMPLQLHIDLPDGDQRIKIIKLILATHNQEVVWTNGEEDLERLKLQTEGFSGSDLKELCRQAVNIPMQEFLDMIEVRDSATTTTAPAELTIRSLCTEDFLRAITKSRHSVDMRNTLPERGVTGREVVDHGSLGIDMNLLRKFLHGLTTVRPDAVD